MRIDVQARNFPLSEDLRSYGERRLRFALACYGDHVRQAVMRLTVINDQRGGAATRCHLKLTLDGLPDVVVEDAEADLNVAIDRATERAGRTLMRKLERQLTAGYGIPGH